MGTLLIMMASIGLMSGCGHTAGKVALVPPAAPAPTAPAPGSAPPTPDGGADETPQKNLAVVSKVPEEPPCNEAPAPRQAAPQKPKPCPKEKKQAPRRWIPEPIAPPSYLNAGGMAPHYMMRSLR